MNYLPNIVFSLALGVGSCSNLSSSSESLEVRVNSGSDIDLPTNSSESLPISIADDTFLDTTLMIPSSTLIHQ